MADPNGDDYLVPDIAKQFKEDRTLFNETARGWTKKYAN